MAKYQKVLVAFDGSSSSRNALRQAFRLANWVKVVAVVPNYIGDLELVGVSNIKQVLDEPGHKLLAEAKAIADEEKRAILLNLEQGEPYERIIHVAEEERCDLIIMGRRGLSQLERTFMGSSTAKVIGYTGKEVLVLPDKCSVDCTNILLASDGSEYCNSATKKAIEIAKSYEGKLAVISVVDMDEEVYAQAYPVVLEMIEKAKAQHETIKKQATEEGLAVDSVVREGVIQDVIADYVAENNTSMIVMGSHGRRGIRKVLMGSVTERVIGAAPCPILVVHHTPA